MIKIENTDVYGFETAIRGMRNPWNSWDKSDSFNLSQNGIIPCFIIGQNDLALMKKLVKAGSDHSKFMRMINVTCDITAPLYWWKEFDTYKVGTVRNSCSTMHTITEKEFTLDDFSHEHLVPEAVDFLTDIVDMLNDSRYACVNWDTEKDKICIDIDDKKDLWWQIIQFLPSSYNQRATVQMNYAVLRNMYHARKNHPLDEWREFCKWIESLPYSELITGGNGDEM